MMSSKYGMKPHPRPPVDLSKYIKDGQKLYEVNGTPLIINERQKDLIEAELGIKLKQIFPKENT